MKKITSAIILLIIVSVGLIVACNPFHEKTEKPQTNDSVESITSFDILDENTGTFAKGSILHIKNNSTHSLKILTLTQISSKDFGGVSFSVEGFDIASVYTDYQPVKDSINILNNWMGSGRIEIGMGHTLPENIGLIEIDLYTSKTNLNYISVNISLGSKITEDGLKIIGPTYKDLTIMT